MKEEEKKREQVESKNYETEERLCIKLESIGVNESQRRDQGTNQESLLRVIETLPPPPPGLRQVSCESCGDDGLVFHTDAKGYQAMLICYCPKGDKHAEPRYRPSDTKKEFPIQIQRAKAEKKRKEDWNK